MVVIGGLTRLTGSGLSIVEWQPVIGILPPLNHQAWQHLFNLYQQSPEFIKVNSFMDLEGFKSIFWLEYCHRLWGRVIGIISIALLIYCYAKSSLKPFRFKSFLLLCLISLQGVVGWLMVRSGLQHNPHVSPLFLALHLTLALSTIVSCLQIALLIKNPLIITSPIKGFSLWLISLLGLITFMYGALVAGHKAGLLYNEFPFMGGHIVPPELLFLKPRLYNFISNPVTVQWTHRLLATITWISVNLWTLKNYSYLSHLTRTGLLVLINLQVILGICTLIYYVPITLAILHQITGIILVSSLIIMALQSRQPRQISTF